MFKKNCFCGKSEKNFNFDKFEYFFDECCEAAGFDHLGNNSKEVQVPRLLKDEFEAAGLLPKIEEKVVENESDEFVGLNVKQLFDMCIARGLNPGGKLRRYKLIKLLTQKSE